MRTYTNEHQQNLTRRNISAASDNVNDADIQPVIDMINDALEDEYRDYYKYMALSEKMADGTDAETVKSMAYDEYKHRRLFEEIYTALTGAAPLPPKNIFKPENIDNLTEVFTDSLFGELDAVELYRDIMFSISNTGIRDMIFEIITDEQSHADLINYLLPKLYSGAVQ